MDAQEIRMIKQMIMNELAPILMGMITSNKDHLRSSFRRLSNESEINNARRILPYGLSSRPPSNMECLTVPIKGEATHINIVGEYDINRPSLEDGEAALYGPQGQVILMKSDGTIHQGGGSSASPAVLGDILQQFADKLIQAFTQAAQLGQGPTGPVFLDPGVRSALNDAKSQFVDTAATNFLSQRTFLDRGGA